MSDSKSAASEGAVAPASTQQQEEQQQLIKTPHILTEEEHAALVQQQPREHKPIIENIEERHAVPNVPMQVPKGSFQVVPGVFVAAKECLPRLIEFFNVTHVVRCVETDAQQCPEDFLTDIGGNAEKPYGDSIPYPKNVFHCPLRDSIDETEFTNWATKAAEFIANVLRIEEQAEVAAAQNENGQADDEDEEKVAVNNEDGGEDAQGSNDDKKTKKQKKRHFDVVQQQNDDDDQQQQEQTQTQTEEAEEENDDIWAPYRDRGSGNIVIHCEKGKSRSPAVAIAYLMLKRGMTMEEAMDMFVDDDEEETNNNNQKQQLSPKLQMNPIFVLELAKLEAKIHGSPLFDLDSYWIQRLQHLFPKVPTSTIAKALSECGGNMIAAREKLMTVAARQFFDRDALMVDALFNIIVSTVDDYRSGSNMATNLASDAVVTKEECSKVYHETGKKRDVALMKLTQLVKERMAC